MKILILYLVFINLLTFAAYGIDKRKAQKNAWRIKESTLLLLAAAGGSVGALLGMQIFRHKTKHPKFTINYGYYRYQYIVMAFAVIFLILLVQIGLAVWWVLR